MVSIKRVYEPADRHDGFRVLVDRLWPRGLSKTSAVIDLWFKEAAPSTALRKWFDHDPEKWEEFKKRYLTELKAKQSGIKELRDLEKREGHITLLYGARDEKFNQAVVLQQLISGKLRI
jgi:uncharacterized protein YeaO (DUF488 family)